MNDTQQTQPTDTEMLDWLSNNHDHAFDITYDLWALGNRKWRIQTLRQAIAAEVMKK